MIQLKQTLYYDLSIGFKLMIRKIDRKGNYWELLLSESIS